MKTVISVIGSDSEDEKLSTYALKTAETVGQMIAEKQAVLVCGGRGGIMQAACQGAHNAGGLTIGVLPESKKEANPFVDIGLVSGLGPKRNTLVVGFGDAVIAIGGRWGTLNEISFALILQKPVILVKGTGGVVDELIAGHLVPSKETSFLVAKSAEDAVQQAFAALTRE